MEEFKDALKRLRIMGKMIGRLSLRRRLMPSGPAELDEFLRIVFRRVSGITWRKKNVGGSKAGEVGGRARGKEAMRGTEKMAREERRHEVSGREGRRERDSGGEEASGVEERRCRRGEMGRSIKQIKAVKREVRRQIRGFRPS